jgi:hypothetical protein
MLPTILAGLCNDELGATLQNRLAVFGEAVDLHLEFMMEEWPMEYFLGQYLKRNGNTFTIGFLTASDGDDFADALETLFKLCGVQSVDLDIRYDDE